MRLNAEILEILEQYDTSTRADLEAHVAHAQLALAIKQQWDAMTEEQKEIEWKKAGYE